MLLQFARQCLKVAPLDWPDEKHPEQQLLQFARQCLKVAPPLPLFNFAQDCLFQNLFLCAHVLQLGENLHFLLHTVCQLCLQILILDQHLKLLSLYVLVAQLNERLLLPLLDLQLVGEPVEDLLRLPPPPPLLRQLLLQDKDQGLHTLLLCVQAHIKVFVQPDRAGPLPLALQALPQLLQLLHPLARLLLHRPAEVAELLLHLHLLCFTLLPLLLLLLQPCFLFSLQPLKLSCKFSIGLHQLLPPLHPLLLQEHQPLCPNRCLYIAPQLLRLLFLQLRLFLRQICNLFRSLVEQPQVVAGEVSHFKRGDRAEGLDVRGARTWTSQPSQADGASCA